MKKYVRPKLSAEVVSDVSEPVYMACSGQGLFEVNFSGYEHQYYETGRMDGRFQVNATYKGPSGYTGDVYLTLTFRQKVNADNWGWHFKEYSDEEGSYKVMGVAKPADFGTLDYDDSIGFGDFIVTLEEGGEVGSIVELIGVTASLSPTGCM